MVWAAHQSGKKIILVGNGGSAAMASHVAVDFTKAARIRAVNFNESDLLTCLSNDYGYERWVEMALEFYADPGDLVILISSSGTMAMAVNFGYRRDRVKTGVLMLITAAFGALFVGMQAFEWTKLIVEEGVRPWGNPMGAPQFGSVFFMITGFHGAHVTAGVIYLLVVAKRVITGFYDRKGNYDTVEIAGLYWHFVDLVWVFIFALFYLW